MILKRIIDENGNEIYIKISFDDALKEEKSVLVFSSEDEEEEYDEALEEDEEEKEEVKEDLHDAFKNIKNIFNSKEVEETLNSTSDILNNVFSFSSNSKKEKTKSQKIISMLPFMDKEDLHELVNDILNGSEEYKDIPLQAIFPFLSEEDCDSLFLKSIEDPNSNINICSLAPFVSEEALSSFVDKYIEGEYQDVNIDILYPFLKSSDIKKLFKYVVNKE